MIKEKFIVIISGSTGVGKTNFALELAQQVPSEIVNADIGQMYKPLTIGTAKPDWKKSTIAHHLFDIIDDPIHFTVINYRKQLLQIINEIWQRNKLPIIVGGSLFYLQSLFFSPISEVEKEIELPIKKKLWDELYVIDPERARAIDPQDIYRIERALAIWYQTGQKPSLYKPQFISPSGFWFLFLMRDRKELYERINQRTKQMIDTGWIEEVKQLQGTIWEKFLHEKKIIGYNEILDYLEKPTQKEKKELALLISQKTRNYAKRQLTFWRMLEKKLNHFLATMKDSGKLSSKAITVNLTLLNLELYIKQLSEELSILF